MSQSVQMDPLERMRRWKRSLDGFISVRKAVLIAFAFLVFLLYVGPSIFEWLFGYYGQTLCTASIQSSRLNTEIFI